jgi:predicted RNA methylase
MKISANVLAALKDRAETNGNCLILTGPRFDPKLYQQVNDVLEAVGGRWASREGAHLFPVDAAEAIAPVLTTGEVVTLREKKQQAQYFPTPTRIVERLLDLADLTAGVEALEPSAGSGAIATAAADRGVIVDCIEQDSGYAAVLAEAGVARVLTVANFLTVPPQPVYDRVVMNPPFTKGADIEHVEHALRFLKPDGLLVSIMSWTVAEHTRKTAKFRALVEARGGTVEAVGEKAFAESGTDVPTVLVAIPAMRPADAKPTVWPAREIPEAEEPEFKDPMEILDELRANLRDAMAEFDALAELLATPITSTREDRTAEVVELPEPRQEQLSLDGFEEAS